ncbi:SCO family protein [Mongoliitalea daihaiensis]|uniref:SCO family protein n=1 Tax=Mongoliitalea daihaiensis TaxID=2782006 RepID=UPI001F467DAE|nr:SCO family protein [Mongoliitalea daihaiensis]UJP66856.1 SCO family protein [Mongoliitalea daihaiensis]
MKGLRILQGLVLLCILLIPVMIIVFLKTFGNNQFDIPVLYQYGVEDAFQECNYPDSIQHVIPDFTFTSNKGLQVGRFEMEGKITIVDFFFTSCPSICPVMSSEMERVDDAFKDNPNVQIYSISIDPDFDTKEVLESYAQKHMASPKWHFLSGDKEETYRLARCGFVLPTFDGYGVPDDFVHSDKFVLVDEFGRIRGYYSGTTREEVDRLIVETKILLHGK